MSSSEAVRHAGEMLTSELLTPKDKAALRVLLTEARPVNRRGLTERRGPTRGRRASDRTAQALPWDVTREWERVRL